MVAHYALDEHRGGSEQTAVSHRVFLQPSIGVFSSSFIYGMQSRSIRAIPDHSHRVSSWARIADTYKCNRINKFRLFRKTAMNTNFICFVANLEPNLFLLLAFGHWVFFCSSLFSSQHKVISFFRSVAFHFCSQIQTVAPGLGYFVRRALEIHCINVIFILRWTGAQ